MDTPFKTYLFEYRHDGATWGLEIKAADASDAQARLKALGWAQYRGECVARIEAPKGLALVASMLGRFLKF